ncbi:MAG: phosphatidylserine/phosphatidylglycerophosphate/cardiolipin synthase family protein [Parachlamydiaceae bacterium]
MVQNFNSTPLSHVLKKIGLSCLIGLLFFAFIQLIQHYHHNWEPTALPSSNTPIELYSNQTQDDLTHLFQHAINNAKESITLIIYALTDPQIIQALQAQSESGISVYIVADAKASPGISHRLPRASIVKSLGQGLMHQKILIIDNKQVWLGSANMTTNSLNIHGNLVMAIDNPALAKALSMRAKSMDETGSHTPLLHREAMINNQNLEVWILPDDPSAVARLIELIRQAKKSIKIAMFTWTRPDLAQEVIAAAKKGIDVEIVIDRYSGKGASTTVVKLLQKHHIPIHLSTGNKLMHHKLAVIDDEILINGSTNWTHAAFEENDDYFTVLYPLKSNQKVKIEKLWKAILKGSEVLHPASPSIHPEKSDQDRYPLSQHVECQWNPILIKEANV